MKLFSIEDRQFNDVAVGSYDVGVFCSGFETRCLHIPTKLDKSKISRPLVLGFSESQLAVNREQNDKFYKNNWCEQIQIVAGNDDRQIYGELSKVVPQKKQINFLVDYSSMSRLWYAALLNWARFQSNYEAITFDFCYSVGDYVREAVPMVIRDILSVPGFEGSWVGRPKTVVVFGIGFEGLAARCVFERLEPDIVYTYMANPAASELALQRARDENSDLLKDAAIKLELPLYNVEVVFRSLSELIRPHLYDSRITFVPMGPKPHVLGALLMGIRYPHVTNLRVSGRGEKEEDVVPQGNVVVTRVHFKKEHLPVEAGT